MRLQKLRHSVDDMGEDCIVTHIVNEIDLGGEFTVSGRAIPDADLLTQKKLPYLTANKRKKTWKGLIGKPYSKQNMNITGRFSWKKNEMITD